MEDALVKIVAGILVVLFLIVTAILGFTSSPVAVVIGLATNPIVTGVVLCIGLGIIVFLLLRSSP